MENLQELTANNWEEILDIKSNGWCLSKSKRVFDILVSSMLLVFSLPLLIIIVLLIKLDSPGPVFFRQFRTGLHGKRFRIWKFRTMQSDAERLKQSLKHLNTHAPDSPDFKIINDPRVTRVGRILRRYSFDEIPNLLNVLVGDMSMVGPRPTSFDVEHYSEHHLIRLVVLPGVTGLWQIAGRSTLDFEDRVKLDVKYIRDQSFWVDLKILLKTPFRMIDGLGAW